MVRLPVEMSSPVVGSIVKAPGTRKAFSDVTSLTSVSIFRLMRPLSSTSGVKPRPTPNCLNSMVMPLSS